MGVSNAMIQKLEDLDPKVRDAFVYFIHEVEEKSRLLSIGREDFNELKGVVQDLGEAQGRTEQRVEELAEAQRDLTEAQGRTEQRVGELTEAQGRTEKRVGELAEAQGRTEQKIDDLGHSLTNQIAALGSRWGIYNEGTFRGTIRGLLSKMSGVEVREGYYGDRQVDVIIRNGEHVILEITSRMHPKDINKIYSSADDYKMKEGIEPTLMVATSYISPRLMEKIMGLERKIEIFSYESEE